MPVLAPDEVSVWKFSPRNLLPFTDRFEKYLSAHEMKRLERLTGQENRQEFIICRGVLHLLLSALSAEEPEHVHIHEDGYGKPRLEEDGHQHALAFNISHTNGLCLIACGREMEVGVDVEYIDPLPELAAMAKKYLAPQEIKKWEELDAAHQTEAFYCYWSAKEALLKALGSGLRISPAQIDTLQIRADKKVSGKQDDGLYFETGECILEELPLGTAYTGWLAVFKRLEKISLYELTAQWLRAFIFSTGRKAEK
ncbi:4'-phosphopantetheinyl transferase [Pelolinea submarina]|uniref:4'-phosphopantetheinyl transferase n=1 Tax=Pelolinea submarina TaxID=913107 RepID=A0A3E0A9N1_9CHLR|nr:4'-phosphopantetheinyl transferase [Pelolinea submarina]